MVPAPLPEVATPTATFFFVVNHEDATSGHGGNVSACASPTTTEKNK